MSESIGRSHSSSNRPGFGGSDRAATFFPARHCLPCCNCRDGGVGEERRGLLIESGSFGGFISLCSTIVSRCVCPSTFRCHLSVMESRLESLSASFPTLGRHVGDVANTADSSAPRWRKALQ